jgi:hypothetical protein
MGHPLWREVVSVVYSRCWVSPAQSFSGSSPAGFMTIVCSLKFEIPPTWSIRFLYLFPPGTGPRHWVDQINKSSQNQSFITTDGQSTTLSWCQAAMWDTQRSFFFFHLKLCLDSCEFLIMGRPLWREDESVIYSCCWALPEQFVSGPYNSSSKSVSRPVCLRARLSFFLFYRENAFLILLHPKLITTSVTQRFHFVALPCRC